MWRPKKKAILFKPLQILSKKHAVSLLHIHLLLSVVACLEYRAARGQLTPPMKVASANVQVHIYLHITNISAMRRGVGRFAALLLNQRGGHFSPPVIFFFFFLILSHKMFSLPS